MFRKLAALGVQIRRGQVALVAAGPGVGKSVFAMCLALDAGVPAYYFSADTDSFTMYLRAAAHVTGNLVSDVEDAVISGHTVLYDTQLNGIDHVRFGFDASPSLDDIDGEVIAFALTYGQWPELIVVDNLSNVWSGEGEGYTSLEATLDFLHELGRKTGAAIIALHHLTGEYDDGLRPAPLSALRGKVSKVPELVLTLYRAGQSTMPEVPAQLGVCPVKNRTGKADASGGFSVNLFYDPERMRLG